MSPRARIPLRKPARLLLPVGGRVQACEFVPSLPEVQVYCLSEERIAQATLRLGTGGKEESWAVAGWADLRVDGRRLRSGDSLPIREGSILSLEPLEPMVFGEYWEGVFSSKQWVNGRMRRQSDLPPPLDLFATLGTAWKSAGDPVTPDASVRLSVRAQSSLDLTERLTRFLEEEVSLPVEFGTVVLARIPDGAIVSAAEVGERRNRGRSSLLERVAPGSAVKPLLAAAILSQRPELGSMEIPARSGRISSVLGMPRVGGRRAFTTTLNCGLPREGTVDLRYFLRCSNNEYAASLLVAGLAEDGVPGESWRGASEIPLEGGRVPRAVLLRSPLSEGVSALFDLPTDPTIADTRRRSSRVWQGLAFSDGTPFQAPGEVLPAESRPALLAPGSSEGTDLGLLYRYAYGAWENQWTLLDLTNAFARVVSDRRIHMAFAPGAGAGDGEGAGGRDGSDGPGAHGGGAGGPDGGGSERGGRRWDGGGPGPDGGEGGRYRGEGRSREDTLGLAGQPWYPRFLSGLRAVAVDGTARGLRDAWVEEGLPRAVYTKTGTLNEAGQPGPQDDLFAKVLLFAVGTPAQGADGPLACGFVGGLYLRFAKGPASGNLPSYQVDFARQHLGAVLRENWEVFGGCSGK
jgi:hypothetical protein